MGGVSPELDEVPAAAGSGLRERTARAAHTWRARIGRVASLNGLVSVVDQAIVSAAGFLTAVLVARVTSQEDLGLYYIAMTIVLFARGFQAQLIFAPYIVYCHRQKGQVSYEYTGSVLFHQLVLMVVIELCLLGLAGVMAVGRGSAGLLPVVAALLAAMPVFLLREFSRAHAFSNLRIWVALAIDATHVSLQLGMLALLAIYPQWFSIAAVYVVMGIAAGVACVHWCCIEWRRWRVRWSRVLPDWKMNWSFSRWALATYLVGNITPLMLPWFLVEWHGEATAGLFGACSTLAGAANMFVAGLGNFISPKTARDFVEGGKAALSRTVRKYYAIFFLTVGSFALLCLAAGEPIVVAVYGARYAGGGLVLAAATAAVLAASMGQVAGNGLWAMNRPQGNFLPDTIGLVVALAGAILLVPSLGSLGAALTAASAAAVASSMKCWDLHRRLRSSSPDCPQGRRRDG